MLYIPQRIKKHLDLFPTLLVDQEFLEVLEVLEIQIHLIILIDQLLQIVLFRMTQTTVQPILKGLVIDK